jgi:hypothetical protein
MPKILSAVKVADAAMTPVGEVLALVGVAEPATWVDPLNLQSDGRCTVHAM